jgi:hypothetical protein
MLMLTPDKFKSIVESITDLPVIGCKVTPNGLLFTANLEGQDVVCLNVESEAWAFFIGGKKSFGKDVNQCLAQIRSMD